MFPMQIFYIIAVLVVVGLALWFPPVKYRPSDATMKQLIRAVLIIFAVLFCLYEVFACSLVAEASIVLLDLATKKRPDQLQSGQLPWLCNSL